MKKIALLLFIAIGIASCKSSSAITSNDRSSTKNSNSIKIIDHIVTTAEDNLGVKYKYAGTTKAGFDCSGLVYTSFQSESISLPRTSFEQARIGEIISVNKAKKGDLIFFKTNGSSKINHVGIITEANNDEIKFIHSSTSKGVIISSTIQKYYKNSFAQINRIIN